jgi:hypothetical protein
MRPHSRTPSVGESMVLHHSRDIDLCARAQPFLKVHELDHGVEVKFRGVEDELAMSQSGS